MDQGQICIAMPAGVTTLEFKFPDGEFEIDTAARVPVFGELVTKRSRVWQVDDVLPGSPPLVFLQPASPGTGEPWSSGYLASKTRYEHSRHS